MKSRAYKKLVRLCASYIDKIANEKLEAEEKLELMVSAQQELSISADKLSVNEAKALHTYYDSLAKTYRYVADRNIFRQK